MDKFDFRLPLIATDALIRFLELHEQCIPSELRQCREALQRQDMKEAIRLAYQVRPGGWGGLMDGLVAPKFDHETSEYCEVVRDSLVRNWCFWISNADDRQSSYWRRLVRAFGRYMEN